MHVIMIFFVYAIEIVFAENMRNFITVKICYIRKRSHNKQLTTKACHKAVIGTSNVTLHDFETLLQNSWVTTTHSKS